MARRARSCPQHGDGIPHPPRAVFGNEGEPALCSVLSYVHREIGVAVSDRHNSVPVIYSILLYSRTQDVEIEMEVGYSTINIFLATHEGVDRTVLVQHQRCLGLVQNIFVAQSSHDVTKQKERTGGLAYH